MPRKPNWTDYTNLVLNAAQTAQLAKVGRELENLRKNDAEQLGLQAIQIKVGEVENARRQVIFQMEQVLRDSQELFNSSPIEGFLAFSLIRQAVVDGEIGPDWFQQFVDKDRVRDFLNGVKVTFDSACSRLSPDQLAQAKTVQQLQGEIKELDELIILLAEQHELLAHQAKLKAQITAQIAAKQLLIDKTRAQQHSPRAKAKANAVRAASIIGFAMAGVFFLIQIVAVPDDSQFSRETISQILSWMLGISLAAAVVLCLWPFVLQGLDPCPDFRDEIRILEGKLQELNSNAPKGQRMLSLQGKFGDRSAMEYQQNRQTRQTAIEEILNRSKAE
jgi:hypothetical protein